MKVNVTETRDGVRIHVAHDESDSLAVIEVRHSRYGRGSLSARVGLRGNFDAKRRPMRWVSTSMEAPLVSARDRVERLYRYAQEHYFRLRPEDFAALQRIKDRIEAEDG